MTTNFVVWLLLVCYINQLLVTEANYIESPIFWLDFRFVYIEFVDDRRVLNRIGNVIGNRLSTVKYRENTWLEFLGQVFLA